MSNLLKSKLFLGVMLVAVLVVAGGAFVGAKSAAADCSITATLRVGSVGTEVSCLQSIVGATADGKFGPMTKASVMAWQAGHGLVADGVVGALTRAALAGAPVAGGSYPAGCSSTAGYSSTTGVKCDSGVAGLPAGCSSTAGYSPTTGAKCDGGSSTPTSALEGTAGTIADVNNLSAYNNEEVGDGSEGVKVAGFEVETSNDGDIQLNSVKVSFASTGNGATESDRIADYLTSVSILMGSTVVGTVDTSDFNKDSTGNYSKVITLDDAIVRSDTIEKFYVAVDAVNNLDSGDIVADSWSVDLENIRYTDGSGVTTTDSSTGVINGMNVGMSFVTFSTSADTELKISTNSTPVAAVVDVDSSNNTDNVVLLKGKLKLEGTSDVLLDAFPVTLTSTGGGITALTGSVTLSLGSSTFTESTGTNCVAEADFSTAGDCGVIGTEGLLFDNLDYTIDAGSTVNFTISADMNDLDATAGVNTNFDAGDTLLAELTTAGRAFIVAENSQGDQLADSTEMSGNALGKVQTFRDTGIQVSLVSATHVSTAIGGAGTALPDKGTYQITFDVTAFGGDMWVDGTKPTLAGTDSIDLGIVSPGTGTLDADIVSVSNPVATMTGTINTTSRFLVSEGDTQRFKITAVVTPTVTAGLYSLSLTSIAYNSADVDITDALPALEYTTNLTDFVTNSADLKLTN
jgi:peptidoglycan hydrolase-like protein with peptidoglycan-binding domain